MFLIPAFKRQTQVLLSEFKASLLHRTSSRIAKATQKPCLEKPKSTTTKKKTNKKPVSKLGIVVHISSPSTGDTEAGEFL